MLSWRDAWSAALLCAVLALFAAPAALGQSAGNQQYVDPLASSTPSSSSASGSAPAAASSPSSTPSPSATASASSSSNSSSQARSTPASGASAASSSRTLPFTGLDLWPAVAIGFGLIGSGLAIRRVARRT
jgi:hypothetical protein